MANVMLAVKKIEVQSFEHEKEMSAVLMNSYGINSVILTEHENLKSLIDEFKNSEDSKWLNGLGKKALYDMLLKRLKKEDKSFKKKPKKMNVNNQKWIDFCNDCVILASLGNVLYEYPIMLMHPNSYFENIQCNQTAWLNGAKGKTPSLIDEIEVLTSQ